jgi:hypothetical protein
VVAKDSMLHCDAPRALVPGVLGLAAGALVALGTLAGVADARVVAYETKVTIAYGNVTKVFDQEFRGKVKSSKHKCEGNRTVKVFHRDPGPDTLVGSTTSKPTGRWSIGNDIAEGRHYAKVKSKAIGAALCRGDRSRTIRVSQP